MNDDSKYGDPIDLSPLDPTSTAAGFDEIASAITRDAMTARARRRAASPDMLTELAGWSRPALLAAVVVLAVAIPALARSHQPARGWVAVNASASNGVDVMGIPQSLLELLRSPVTPSLAQIDEALAPTGVSR